MAGAGVSCLQFVCERVPRCDDSFWWRKGGGERGHSLLPHHTLTYTRARARTHTPHKHTCFHGRLIGFSQGIGCGCVCVCAREKLRFF